MTSQDTSEQFGEIRSLLQQPHSDAFDDLCAYIESQDAGLSEDIRAYIELVLARWPEDINRTAPYAWLTRALRHNQEMPELNFCNDIKLNLKSSEEDLDLVGFAHTSSLANMKSLTIETNHVIGHDSLKTMLSSDVLKGLEHCHFLYGSMTPADLEALVYNEHAASLRSLCVWLSDDTFKAFKVLCNKGGNLTKLESLSLTYNSYPASCIRMLGEACATSLTSLRHLELPCRFGVEELEALLGYGVLWKGLVLDQWNLKLKGARVLAKCEALCELEELDVGGAGFKGSAFKALSRSPYLTNLKTLKISGHHIDQKVVDGVLAGDAFEHLTHLNMWACEFETDALSTLVSSAYFKDLEEIELSSVKTLSAKDLSTLFCASALPSLKRVVMQRASFQGKPALTVPAHAESIALEELDLYNTPMDPSLCAWFGVMPALKKLDLNWSQMTSAQLLVLFEQLAAQELEVLRLYSADFDQDAMRAFAAHPMVSSLRELDLSNCPIDSHMLPHLLSVLPRMTSLRVLKLGGLPLLVDDVVALIQALPAQCLRELYLGGLPLCDVGTSALVRTPCFTSLTRLELSNCKLDEGAFLDLVHQAPSSLQHLDVSHSPLSMRTVEALKCATHVTMLHYLNVRGTGIQLSQLQALIRKHHMHSLRSVFAD